jgi:CBS domain containing-hemolysin-like protein
LYVAAEFAAVGARHSRIRRLAEDGHRLARRLLPHIEEPASLDRYVGTSQIGITVSSLVLGAYAQATFGSALAPGLARFGLTEGTAGSISATIVLLILTAVQLVLGELVPKALALQYPTQAAVGTVLPIEWSLAVLRPLLVVLNGTASAVLRVFGVREQTHRHLHSPEEIDLLISESQDGGLLEPEERQRLKRALNLGLRTARDLMAPLDRLVMLEDTASWDDVVHTAASNRFSRLPVYRGTRDHIVGLVRTKDLIDRYIAEGPRPVERLMRPVARLPESAPADRVLTELRGRRQHAAVVVDASDRAIGLITIQDVLSELLGLRPSAPDARRTTA